MAKLFEVRKTKKENETGKKEENFSVNFLKKIPKKIIHF